MVEIDITMREIKNLSGYYWVYPGKPNAFDKTVETRTAYNPRTGESLNARQAQTAQHGGVPFEKQVPLLKRLMQRAQKEQITQAYIQAQARQGVHLTKEQALHSQELKDIKKALHYKSNKANSKKAQALSKIYPDRRPLEADYPVGETPDEAA